MPPQDHNLHKSAINLPDGETKIIFITGGVMSGIGKGIVTSSIGMLLQSRGFRVQVIKCDPYLQVDPGTQSPLEHGEIFVTQEVWEYEEGGTKFAIAELDQDFGNYERFLDINLHPSHNITSGQIFFSVLNNERAGKYLGQTVQMIPHVTNEIKRRIYHVIETEKPDFLLIEIGGTTGDIEGELFLESARQIFREYGKARTMLTHVTWLPYNRPVAEFKTKPTQHSISLLFSKGLFPEFIICRSDEVIDEHSIEKIALYSNLEPQKIIKNPNCPNIYRIPLVFEDQDLCSQILSHFGLQARHNVREIVENITKWERMVEKLESASIEVHIGIGGKYLANADAYFSIKHALLHAGIAINAKVKVSFIDVETFTPETDLSIYDGILIPGGFGLRGTDGKILLAARAITEKIPFLGICFGMQMAVVAIARQFCNIPKANSIELDEHTTDPVITFCANQRNLQRYGGTMRLGAYQTIIKQDTLTYKLYNNPQSPITERHRHRLEVNPKYRHDLEKFLIISGVSKDDPELVEFIELPLQTHPFFIGTQAHPEFKSRLFKPHPLFSGFIQAAYERRKNSVRMEKNGE